MSSASRLIKELHCRIGQRTMPLRPNCTTFASSFPAASRQSPNFAHEFESPTPTSVTPRAVQDLRETLKSLPACSERQAVQGAMNKTETEEFTTSVKEQTELEDAFESLNYVLNVFNAMLTRAEVHCQLNDYSQGPLSQQGVKEQQLNADAQDVKDMAEKLSFYSRHKSFWDNGALPGLVRRHFDQNAYRKHRRFSNELLDEMLVQDIIRRVQRMPFKTDNVQALIQTMWPAYVAARERQGHKDPTRLDPSKALDGF
ncbi:hypothetical protein QBC35DRAFT_475468 [Podospora australis]|uniref:Uncharacterized protein n=1 Tax=Podospora australis TaxID=1536484 RepID=A0AAN7AFA0_9PEZI|nr:hypothetical protein QBC35DRAFT_475468 [Podospora australis]